MPIFIQNNVFPLLRSSRTPGRKAIRVLVIIVLHNVDCIPSTTVDAKHQLFHMDIICKPLDARREPLSIWNQVTMRTKY
jgi:hypothetical protein